jgi:hypothetical protein
LVFFDFLGFSFSYTTRGGRGHFGGFPFLYDHSRAADAGSIRKGKPKKIKENQRKSNENPRKS